MMKSRTTKTRHPRLAALACVMVSVLVTVGAAEAGQARGPRAGSQAEPTDGVSATELQRLFDAYTLMQAQEALQLSDEQYPRFLARLRALQDVRRRNQAARLQALRELRRLLQEPEGRSGGERLRDQMKDLRAINERMSAEVARATEAIDEVLEPTQQARLRLFEEQMERRKLDLLMRARRGGRGRLQP